MMQAIEYPFSITIEVRFRDIDAMGHVNNAVYFTYMETTRSRFMKQFFNIQHPQDIPIILGETSCRFLSPILLGETIRVGVGVSRFGNKSFEMVYQIDGEDNRPVAVGRSVTIMYDYSIGQTMPIPQEFKEQIRAFQGDWQPPAG